MAESLAILGKFLDLYRCDRWKFCMLRACSHRWFQPKMLGECGEWYHYSQTSGHHLVLLFSRWWFQMYLYFCQIPGEMIQFDVRIFFRWVAQPPTSLFFQQPHWYSSTLNTWGTKPLISEASTSYDWTRRNRNVVRTCSLSFQKSWNWRKTTNEKSLLSPRKFILRLGGIEGKMPLEKFTVHFSGELHLPSTCCYCFKMFQVFHMPPLKTWALIRPYDQGLWKPLVSPRAGYFWGGGPRQRWGGLISHWWPLRGFGLWIAEVVE